MPSYDLRVSEDTLGPLGEGPTVCPFVAFEDDRDHRSGAPDYRHRCFAAAEPEPRAFPHQERYCLSADFARCPIFLDWARQEAAGMRPTDEPGPSRGTAAAGVAVAVAGDGAPAFLAARGRGEPIPVLPPGRRSSEAEAGLWSYDEGKRLSSPTAPPAPSSLSDSPPAVAMARRGPTHPGWEKPPRADDFPRLRSRDDRRANQALLFAVMGVAVLMVALILVPILLSNHGTSSAGPSPSGSTAVAGSLAPGTSLLPSASQAPGSAGPTFLQYAVKSGDYVALIAKRFNLQVWELMLANPQVTNPDHIEVGQLLNIPPAGLLTRPPATPSPAST